MSNNQQNLLRTRARNLFVISSAIIIYLLAGADIEQLAVGALKAPAEYPEVLRAAAVGALIWFWWRYLIVWLSHRKTYRESVLGALHSTQLFQRHLRSSLQTKYADALEQMEIGVSRPLAPQGVITHVYTDKQRRFCATVQQVNFQVEGKGLCATHPPPGQALVVDIPWWLYFRLIVPVAIWQAVRQEEFADVILPHITFLAAMFLVWSALFWVDPAGVFGFLSQNYTQLAPASGSAYESTVRFLSLGRSNVDPPATEEVLQNPVAWIALVVSILVAIFTIRRSRRDYRRKISHDYLTAASRLLEQAFEAFDRARSDEWNNLPKPDRLLWLTVARMLTESERTAQEIKEDSHLTLYNYARDFWRGKLDDLLRPLNNVPLTYFAENADSILGTIGDQRMCISERSLVVVLNFLKWPENKIDPLEGTKGFTDEEINQIGTVRYRAVGDFLEAQNAMASGNDERKDYWRKQWPAAGRKPLT